MTWRGVCTARITVEVMQDTLKPQDSERKRELRTELQATPASGIQHMKRSQQRRPRRRGPGGRKKTGW